MPFLLSRGLWGESTYANPIRDEYTWASGMMAGLSQDCVEVKEVTTDPDSCAGQAGKSLFKDSLQANPPTHYLDTRHLSENIRQSIKRDDKLLQISRKERKPIKPNFWLILLWM